MPQVIDRQGVVTTTTPIRGVKSYGPSAHDRSGSARETRAAPKPIFDPMTKPATLPLKAPPLPEPTIALGEVGRKLWTDTLTEFGDWNPHELRTLNLACLAYQQASEIAAALAAGGLSFKEQRQLRADWNAAANEHRRQMRELSLSAAPADSRPQRIPGRYA